jgi:hypothetical protein
VEHAGTSSADNPTLCNGHEKPKTDQKEQYLPIALADQKRRNIIVLLRVQERINEIPSEDCHIDGERDEKAVPVQQLYAAFYREYEQRSGSEIER